jgi:hypothetical protein
MSKKKENNTGGCIALILIGIGITGCLVAILQGNENGWYLGPLIPIGYLMAKA